MIKCPNKLFSHSLNQDSFPRDSDLRGNYIKTGSIHFNECSLSSLYSGKTGTFELFPGKLNPLPRGLSSLICFISDLYLL